ncbi:MAG TPA: DNA repair protein RecN [Chloroflexia bacterium]|nr:DNA repair protein RecN [Chloroflexia bacterium]
MLVELNITNFAIIDRLNLRLSPGFNALTGETGAGKSIIIDAMGAMLGEKTGVEFVRHGTDRARVEGYFEVQLDLEDERFRRLVELLKDNELLDAEELPEPNLDGQDPTITLTLSRELTSSGRSICRINGSTVKTDILREVGQALVDIHGQTEHISLLRISEHLELIDQYAGLAARRRKLGEMVGQLRSIRKERQSLQKDERELVRRTELLKYQVSEIEAANLQAGEEEELLKERQLQNAAEKISSIADEAYRVLYQGYDEDSAIEGGYAGGGRGRGGRAMPGGGSGRSVQESLSEVEGLLQDLVRYEESFNQHIEAVQEARYRLEDVSHAVREFRDRVEHDPNRLEEVEERLELIRSLKRKYGSTVEEILDFYKNAVTELSSIEHSGERIAELTQQEGKLLSKIGSLATEISAERRKAGDKLAKEVERSLQDLRLLRARFEVNITQTEDPHGAPVKGPDGEVRRLAFDGKGIDRVEFLVSLNPGEPPKPLQKVASGGETSRLMLALKSILAGADAIPTLIFDEVDVGVGGRSGQVVGEKLWQLTNQGQHQVICITHLPQIAAFGDSHYHIIKRVEEERTATQVYQLSEKERVDELAAMLGGSPVTDTMRLSAREMLQEIRGWKTAHESGQPQLPFASFETQGEEQVATH